jgi:RNA polymerase sigma factor (sigma-70 family)
MENILDVLFKKHSTWIKYVKSFGCDDYESEDYVQEMYIKIFNYTQKKENDLMYNEDEVNFIFVYVVLRNMYYDNFRKKKVIIGELTDDFIADEQSYSEIDFNQKNDAVLRWLVNIDSEIESIYDYNKRKANLLYIKFIYDKIFIDKMSVTELSKEVGISYWSLRNTILTIKKQIKNEVRRTNECIR